MAGLKRHLELYSNAELVEEINNLLSWEDYNEARLAACRPDDLQYLYMGFLQVIFATNMESYLSVLHAKAPPDVADTFTLGVLARYLRSALDTTSGVSWVIKERIGDGVRDKIVPFDTLRLSDITDPKPMRTRVILSCLVNVANLRDSQLEVFNTVRTKVTAIVKQRREDMEATDKAKAAVEEAREEAPEKNKRQEERTQRREESEIRSQQSAEAKKSVQRIYKGLKSEAEGLKSEIKELSDHVRVGELKSHEQRRQLVKSPERMRQEIKDSGVYITMKRQELSKLEDMMRQRQAKYDRLSQIEKGCKKVMEQLSTCEGELKKLSDARKDVKVLVERLEEARIESDELVSAKEMWESQCENARERLNRAIIHAEASRKDLTRQMEEAKAEYQRVTGERTKADERLDGDRKKVHELEKEIATLIDDAQRSTREVLTEYWRFMNQWDNYMTAISRRLHLGT